MWPMMCPPPCLWCFAVHSVFTLQEVLTVEEVIVVIFDYLLHRSSWFAAANADCVCESGRDIARGKGDESRMEVFDLL